MGLFLSLTRTTKQTLMTFLRRSRANVIFLPGETFHSRYTHLINLPTSRSRSTPILAHVENNAPNCECIVCRDQRLLRDDRTRQGKVPDVGEGKGYQGRGMARGMRAADPGTGKHRGNCPHRPAPQLPGCRRVPRHHQHTALQLRRVREA